MTSSNAGRYYRKMAAPKSWSGTRRWPIAIVSTVSATDNVYPSDCLSTAVLHFAVDINSLPKSQGLPYHRPEDFSALVFTVNILLNRPVVLNLAVMIPMGSFGVFPVGLACFGVSAVYTYFARLYLRPNRKHNV